MIEIVYFNEDKYVWAKNLYKKLELDESNYATNVKRWLESKYLFQNTREYKAPTKNYDFFEEKDVTSLIDEPTQIGSIGSVFSDMFYSQRVAQDHNTVKGNFSKNYLIRLELAKLITVNSNSAFKDQLIQWLLSIEAQLESNQLMSRNSLFGLMEMVKMCTYLDNQIEYYKQHKKRYFEDKEVDDKWDEFDKFRNSVLRLISVVDLNEKYIEKVKKKPGTKLTKIEKLAIVDALESVRVSLFDFLSQQLLPYTHSNIIKAKDLADFVKKLFETAGISQLDIKPRGFSNAQLDLFRPIEDIVNVKLISQTLKELGR